MIKFPSLKVETCPEGDRTFGCREMGLGWPRCEKEKTSKNTTHVTHGFGVKPQGLQSLWGCNDDDLRIGDWLHCLKVKPSARRAGCEGLSGLCSDKKGSRPRPKAPNGKDYSKFVIDSICQGKGLPTNQTRVLKAFPCLRCLSWSLLEQRFREKLSQGARDRKGRPSDI